MSFKSLDFAYHRGADNKFAYTLNWTQNSSYKDFKAPGSNRFWDKMCGLCVLQLTSTQDLLQASRFLRLVHNFLKKIVSVISC